MTSKEFEVMRNAQKAEIKIEVQRALADIRAEIQIKFNEDAKFDYYTADRINQIINEKMREYE